jgi:hypothetical protein
MRPRVVILYLLLTFTFSSFVFAHSDSDGRGRPVPSVPSATELGITFDPSSSTKITIERDGKSYIVDVAAKTIVPVEDSQADSSSSKAQLQASTTQQNAPADQQTHVPSNLYIPGDDLVFTLPTGRRLQKGGVMVNFTHRFPYQAAFSGPALGHTLLGLDNFAIPSFGFTYGVTNRIAVSAFRSPSIIGRPIQLMAAFGVLAEHDGQPFNLEFRFSVQGQNDFQRNFTENFELIASRSITRHAQFYFVPTFSIHNRPVIGLNSITNAPPYQPCDAPVAAGSAPLIGIRPCADTVALGFGLSVDIRPTVALLAEVNPTVVNGNELGIHRPAYSFGIQKKILRHAFTFGFTNGAGVTVAQRSSTRATYLRDPSADKPSGMFVGFNLSRQLR